ncbi:MAG TPA: rhodanese-like domain-containing protein [Rickettsiales bacterium]|nr:rhodanese-like domain-containing protein [Rickettsiales bacterium]
MPIKNIDSQTLKGWMERGEAVLVDVREPSEHATGVIPGAFLLPLSNVSRRTVPAHTGKKLVMQCRSGMRSQTAGNILLADAPDQEIYNLAGGILEWVASGNPIK